MKWPWSDEITGVLDINKAHGYNGLLKMMTICDASMIRPLPKICNNSIESGMFQDIWKKIQYCSSALKRRLTNYNYRLISPVACYWEIIIENIIQSSMWIPQWKQISVW